MIGAQAGARVYHSRWFMIGRRESGYLECLRCFMTGWQDSELGATIITMSGRFGCFLCYLTGQRESKLSVCELKRFEISQRPPFSKAEAPTLPVANSAKYLLL